MKNFRLDPERFNAYDILIKMIGLVALFASGYFALVTYHASQEREYKKIYYEKQLSEIGRVFDVLTELDLAKTDEEKEIAAKKFRMIYLGSGRTFLTPKMYDSLNGLTVDYVFGCIQKKRKPVIINDCSAFSAAQSSTGFADTARRELAEIWSIDFKKIGDADPFVAKVRP